MDKFLSKTKMFATMFFIVFLAYNVVLFVISGFSGHGESFWISYTFVIVAFVVVATTGWYLIQKKKIQARDWLLGYPVLKHSTIFIAVEFAFSVTFMLLDNISCPWWIAFVVQVITLVIHLLFVISCFIAQKTIVDVKHKYDNVGNFIKTTKIDVEMITRKCKDDTVKKEFAKLSDQVRFSDPVSNVELLQLETQISEQINTAMQCIEVDNNDGALICCEKVKLLLVERNSKCRTLK